MIFKTYSKLHTTNDSSIGFELNFRTTPGPVGMKFPGGSDYDLMIESPKLKVKFIPFDTDGLLLINTFLIIF